MNNPLHSKLLILSLTLSFILILGAVISEFSLPAATAGAPPPPPVTGFFWSEDDGTGEIFKAAVGLGPTPPITQVTSGGFARIDDVEIDPLTKRIWWNNWVPGTPSVTEDIYNANLDGSDQKALGLVNSCPIAGGITTDDPSGLLGIVLDPANQRLFYTRGVSYANCPNGEVSTVDMDGTGQGALDQQSWHPDGIELSGINPNIIVYWGDPGVLSRPAFGPLNTMTDAGGSKVIGQLPGSFSLSNGAGHGRSLAVDASKNLLFYSSHKAATFGTSFGIPSRTVGGGIFVVDLSATPPLSATIVLSDLTDTGIPDVELDTANMRIYWTDYVRGEIRSASYGVTGTLGAITTEISGLTKPYGLALRFDDFTPPDAPTGLGLTAASDTGSSNSDNITNKNNVDITGVAEDGSTVSLSSDLDGFLDSGLASTFVIPVSLSEGTHQVNASATDVAGNTGQNATVTIVVDNTDPVTTFDPEDPACVPNCASSTTLADGDHTSSRDIEFQYSTEETNPDTTQCKLEGVSQGVIDDFLIACDDNTSTTYDTLSDDVYTLTLKHKDLAGNFEATPTFTWTVDNVAPITTLAAVTDGIPETIADGGFSNSTTMNFPFTVNDAAGSTPTTTDCRKDSDAFAACVTTKILTGLSEAAHTFQINSTDSVGNVEATQTFSWTADFTPPAFTVPADVRTNATAGSATNTTSIIPEIVIPTLTDVDPSPTINDPRKSSYDIGNTTLTWTSEDAAGNTLSKDQIVTVARVTIDSLEIKGTPGVIDSTPLWDVEELNMTGTAHGYFAGEKITVRWGDGLTTDVPVSAFTNGDANSGATWSAFHNYTADFSSQTLTANATLVSNPDVTISFNETIIPAPHPTTLSIKTIADVDTKDVADPSVPWGFNYAVGFNMTDSVFNALIAPSLTLDGLPLDYTDSTANTTSVLVTGTVSDNADGTADVSETFLALEGEVANIGLKSVNATFVATNAFQGSDAGADLTISPHHTSITFDSIPDVDLTDSGAGSNPSVPWGFGIDVNFTFKDENATAAQSLSGNNRLNETQTISYIGSTIINPSFVTQNQTSGNDASSESLTAPLTAKGSGNVGQQTINATFSATANYLRSTNQTNANITAHHTSLAIDDIEDVDTTDLEDPSIFWAWFFDGTFTLADLNATDATTLVGVNRLNETLNVDYSGTALGPSSTTNFKTTGNDASSVTNINELTAANAGSVGEHTLTLTFPATANYLTINTSADMNVTKRHTSLTMNEMISVTNGSSIAGIGFLTDLNQTTSFVPGFVAKGADPTDTTEGKTITFDGTGVGLIQTTTTEGTDFDHIQGTNLQVISCPTCSPNNLNVLELPINGTITFPDGVKAVAIDIQNTGANYVAFNVTRGDGITYPEPALAMIDETTSGGEFRTVTITGSNVFQGIKKITVANVTAALGTATLTDPVGITFIELTNSTALPPSITTINFTEATATGSYTVPFTLNEGTYTSTGNSTTAVVIGLNLNSTFAETANFFGSESENRIYDTIAGTISAGAGGIGGTVSIAPDSGTGFAASNCTLDDDDEDGLCDVWETPQLSLGYVANALALPYFISDVDSDAGDVTDGITTSATNDDTTPDIYVEIDYMTDHKPSIQAINDVIASFAAEGFNLHVRIDESLTHVNDLNVWRDLDSTVTNDFDSIKKRHFGLVKERPTVTSILPSNILTPSGFGPTLHTSFWLGNLFTTESEIGLPPSFQKGEGRMIFDLLLTFPTDPGTVAVVSATASGGETGTGFDVQPGGTIAKGTVSPTADPLVKIMTIEMPYVVDGPIAGVSGDGDVGFISLVISTSSAVAPFTLTPFSDPYVTTTELEARAQLTHYALFAHNIGIGCDGPSGLAETPGNDLMTGLGCNWGDAPGSNGAHAATEPIETASEGSIIEQSGTFMHELGHNLGLLHGGPQKQADTGFLTTNAAVNCKPNYHSVMNYALQTDVYSGFTLDYSRGIFTDTPLDETDLNEATGLPVNSGVVIDPIIVFGTPTAGSPVDSTFTSGININWNAISPSTQTSVSADINNLGINGCDNSAGQTLIDNDDWGNLVLDFKAISGGSFDGTVNLDPFTKRIKNDAASGLDWYDGLLKHHLLFGNPGNDIRILGQTIDLSFQYFSCDPNNPDDPADDTCIDKNKIVKQDDFYNDPKNGREIPTSQSIIDAQCETDEDDNIIDERAFCNEEVLSILTGRDMHFDVIRVSSAGSTNTDTFELIGEEFHEHGDEDGFYHFNLKTTDFPGAGEYDITIYEQFTVGDDTFIRPLFDLNSDPAFRAFVPDNTFEVDVGADITVRVTILSEPGGP